MERAGTDSLGRATFHHITRRDGVCPTARELRWFKHIERHGPQSSQHLHELTCDTHRCKDTTLRQLQKLRASGFLKLPPQQRRVAKADFNPYVYDLGERARDYLVDLGEIEPTVRPTGHWWHSFTTARVTSAIDIAAGRCGTRFIPAHTILAMKDSTLAIPIGRHRLIPDQLFALDYGGAFRAFALEVDRGTEPKASRARRKSWRSSIELYRELIERQLYKSHFGLKANLLVLWVFSRRSDELRFDDMVRAHAGKAGAAFLTKTLPDFGSDQPAASGDIAAVAAEWSRPIDHSVSIVNREVHKRR